jgi:serine/threonine protein kinase
VQETDFVGRILGGTYRILRRLDQGGMALVLAAEHLRLRRNVAVKILAGHLVDDRRALLRFRKEAEMIAGLVHPHIVQVVDFDTTENGQPYLVMELLEGESLGTRLLREGGLPVGETVRIVTQIASGLSAAHAASIVHRDLKPANVFLVQVPSEGSYVKLLDFGISKSAGDSDRITGDRDVIGTPAYMSPEQALAKKVDHRADQFALAVMAYEMLSGSCPFECGEVMAALYRIVNVDPPFVCDLAPWVPVALGEVLARGLSKDPGRRYPGVREFAAAFAEAAGEGRTSSPRGASSGGPEPRPSPRPPMDPANAERPTSREQVGSLDRAAPAHGGAASREAPTLDAYPLSPEPAPESPKGSPPAPAVPPGASPARAAEGATDPVHGVHAAVEQARAAYERGQVHIAMDHAEMAIGLCAIAADGEVTSALERAASLLDAIAVAQLGGVDGRVLLSQGCPWAASLELSPQHAFLLSRLEGGLTIDEAFDVSGMTQRDTLRVLAGLVRRGIAVVQRSGARVPTRPRGEPAREAPVSEPGPRRGATPRR